MPVAAGPRRIPGMSGGKQFLIVVAVLLLGGGIGYLAWRDARHPLGNLRARQVSLAQVTGFESRRTRDLQAAETREICRLLASSAQHESFRGQRKVTVTLDRLGEGRIEIHGLETRGANVVINAGGSGEKAVSLSSKKLGALLSRLAREMNARQR